MKLPLALLALALAADAAACRLMRIAEWPVRASQQRPVLEGEINGRKVGILLDTAAPHGLIARSAAIRLGLARREIGLEPETHKEIVIIDELRIGKSSRQNLRVVAAGEHEFAEDFSLILGEDFVYQADLEFDLGHNAVRVYQAKDCADARLAYWSPQALEVPLQRDDDKIAFNVAVNGQVVRAVLDSAAANSVLGLEQAKARGVHPGSAGAAPAGCVRGFGAKPVDAWAAPFESFSIGDELIRHPRLRFADLWLHTSYTETGARQQTRFARPPQMLLGADFLRSHRVLVSRSQGKMYFTYEGGTVFPEVPARGCNAPPTERAKTG